MQCEYTQHTCIHTTNAGSELSSGEEELNRKEEARLRATQRSRDLREKLKRKNHRKEKEGSASDAEPSRHSASDDEYVYLHMQLHVHTCSVWFHIHSIAYVKKLSKFKRYHISNKSNWTASTV